MDKNESKNFHWQASVNSEGTLELSLYFPEEQIEQLTKEKKEFAIAQGLSQSHKFMLSKGYLSPDCRFLSSSDIAQEYGHTRQYWEKLINEGKIPYKETSAGRITTNLWVQGYLNNKEKVDEYIRNRNKVVDLILKEKNKIGKTICPQCKESSFEYAVNINSVNGICRARCGFRIDTTI